MMNHLLDASNRPPDESETAWVVEGDDDDDASQSLSDDDDDDDNDNELEDNNKEEDVIEQQLARKETRMVNRLKTLLYMVLLFFGVGVSAAIYAIISRGEYHQFEVDFSRVSQKLHDNANVKLHHIFGQLQGLGASVSSNAMNDVWPNFTLRGMELRSESLASTNAGMNDLIVLAPLIFDNTAWEDYAWKNQRGWMDESLKFRGISSLDPGNISRTIYPWRFNMWSAAETTTTTTTTTTQPAWRRQRRDQQTIDEAIVNQLLPEPALSDDEAEQVAPPPEQQQQRTIEQAVLDIHGFGGIANNNAAAAVPVWQMGPVPARNASIINLDLQSHPVFFRMLQGALQQRTALLSPVVDLNFLLYPTRVVADDPQQPRVMIDDDDEEPRSFLVQPVFDKIVHPSVPTTADDNDNNNKATIVAALFASIPWKAAFTNVLSSQFNGVIVDIADTCGSAFTFVVNGPNVSFVGYGGDNGTTFVQEIPDARLGGAGTNLRRNDKYAYLTQTFDLATRMRLLRKSNNASSLLPFECYYTMSVSPSLVLEEVYRTDVPDSYNAVVMIVFLLTIVVFVTYDCMVQRRQEKVLTKAERTTAIISTFFPKNIQERIMQDAQEEAEWSSKKKKKAKKESVFTAKYQMNQFLSEDSQNALNNNTTLHGVSVYKTKPIAEFHPNVTLFFADLVGFTAWSSMRDPVQVFTLLETVYAAFDVIAKRRGVFKVETVGDCYVAACGLPKPRDNHAVVAARFARDCMYKMQSMVKRLEVTLGPDTTELGIRVGLHSGAVTAGVIRGDRSRFQLFGDTINTTSRIETTGVAHKIHVSEDTAKLLIAARKSHWIIPRQEKVMAKGKGELQTFWLVANITNSHRASSVSSDSQHHHHLPSLGGGTSGMMMSSSMLDASERGGGGGDSSVTSGTVGRASFRIVEEVPPSSAAAAASSSSLALTAAATTNVDATTTTVVSDKHSRLIDWFKDVFIRILQEIALRRQALGIVPASAADMEELEQAHLERQTVVLEEVQDIITLPDFDSRMLQSNRRLVQADQIDLGEPVVTQLRDYVQIVSAMYKDNPFHNFEHASHVTMSVVKLLSRIVAPDLDSLGHESTGCNSTNSNNNGHESTSSMAGVLHDYTYGITSDPLTQFAVVFSALIHDADHPGVPNSQLVKEGTNMAATYKNKSVAEQNSVDIAWDLLMDPGFTDLRRAIFCTPAEFHRFRALVVNVVMATDIMDKDLGAMRKARWEKAFSSSDAAADNDCARTSVNRKATIVIEHLIQASDVAHTMQHWYIYQKWNARLFEELHRAYMQGRAEKNPAEFWYKGELGFFDFYIIPLAKKLKDCGVFGVSSDEYLNYAMKNREEWELKGEAIVEEKVRLFAERAKTTSVSLLDGAMCSHNL